MKRPQRFPLNPKHPERICWGCDKYCPADNLMCGNGSGRTEHPAEMLGEDWYEWEAWGLGPAEGPKNEGEEGVEPGKAGPSSQEG